MTLLHYLAWSSKTSSGEFCNYHQRTRVNLQATTADGLTPLHLAAQRGNITIIEYITQTATTAFNRLATLRDSTGRTALHYAVESKRAPEAITCLLSQAVDIRAKDRYRRSALHHAARLGRLPAVETLVAALLPDLGDELYVADVWGMTPAMIAAHHRKYAVAAFLEQRTGLKTPLPLPLIPCDPAAKEVNLEIPKITRRSSDRASTEKDPQRGTKTPKFEHLRDVGARGLLAIWVCAGVLVVWVLGKLFLVVRQPS